MTQKTFFIWILALCFSTYIYSQHPAEDALKLLKTLDNGRIADTKDNFQILKHYTAYRDATGNVSSNEIKQAFGNAWGTNKDDPNPFLSANGIIRFNKGGFSTTGKIERQSRIDDLINQVGGVDVTLFADGLAKFLVKRFKEEMTVGFFQKFKEELNAQPELKRLFPLTSQTLLAFNFTNYKAYLESLREAFFQDFEQLYIHLPHTLDVHAQDWFQQYPKLLASFAIASEMVEALNVGVHPAVIIADLAQNNDLAIIDPKVQEALQVLAFLSNSMRASTGDQYWLPKNNLLELFAKPKGIAIYLGLLYQKLKEEDIPIGASSFKEKLDSLAKEGQEIQAFLEQLVRHIHLIEQQLQHLKALPKAKDRTVNDYYQLVDAIVELLEVSMDNSYLEALGINIPESIQDDIQKLFTTTELVHQLYLAVEARNYQGSILYLSQLLETLLEERYTNEFQKELFKYGTFMATMLNAKDSDEVAAAIETVALPTGSFRLKRQARFSVELNAYLGGYAGCETLYVDVENTNSAAPALPSSTKKLVIGMTAPVGINLGWGTSKNASFSIFIPLIDLGAITLFRFDDMNTQALPQIKLENIFAPGAYVVYGFPNSVFSIGAGAQIGPLLRGISQGNTGLTTKIQPNWRYGLTFTADLPLISFSAKAKDEDKMEKRRLKKAQKAERKRLKKEKNKAM